ncbi:microcin C ABC transporter permease YejB [Acinetobacter haemolyticus]|uniref:microcin C ABC transporter permease YejB n=1 Tax=Acinetobacter haemolyticus TaxID=29430 RepID=UPI0002F6FAFA|nr:microcin C ABC transporter permease YejB [Acinetobacter haemolyticus]MCU4379278.1 microcin C ABC transporter permease YejB [Acinetobacter haemolyticus]NAR59203.1 microcin C ABC transporter permease YejB [Acinetobacter haemolyticus]NAR68764.1 microcin C ABC transporter permease YejB [Acinetobacter haemolyticus]NAR91300.1 microcin C ABC transporter permease YejB [Acinetobacter haemolyticus]SUU22902.1 oligopeptide ABC transporter [Acinetobacter haemolyticus]
MRTYILKRLLLIIPTLFFILLINFAVIQIAPGGPVEQAIQQAQSFQGVGLSGGETAQNSQTQYQGARGLSAEMVEQIKAQYGFDKSAPERFWLMLKGYLSFDFGTSFFKDKPVTQLLYEKMPVTISLGLWSTLLIYLVSIPLGIRKAKQHGLIFDKSTSLLLAVGYAVPSFVFAVLLIVFFAGGSYFQWFPLQGLVSENFAQLSMLDKIKDYFWHMSLPLLSIVLGGFAGLTYLTKYSFMEELNKQYVLAARSKGLTENRVLYGHVFRNAMLIVIAGLPEALVGIFFVGNLFIEIIFNLDGLGLLGFEAIVQRDYPVIFGTLFLFTLLGLILRLISDVLYQVIDPRINFDSRGVK